MVSIEWIIKKVHLKGHILKGVDIRMEPLFDDLTQNTDATAKVNRNVEYRFCPEITYGPNTLGGSSARLLTASGKQPVKAMIPTRG